MFIHAKINQPCGVKQTGGIQRREEQKKKRNRTAIVNIDLDRTDSRFHSFDVLKGVSLVYTHGCSIGNQQMESIKKRREGVTV